MPCTFTESSTKILRLFHEQFLLQSVHQFGSQEPLILLLFKAEAVLFRKEQLEWSYQKKDWNSTAVSDTGFVRYLDTGNLPHL